MNQPAEQKAQTKALFIADLHLQPAMRKTTEAFLNFLQNQGKQAEQLYILGDLFEYWAGDDDMDSEALQVILSAIRQVADSGTSVYWLSGNRDFLTGDHFLEVTGAKALPELAVVDFGTAKVILAHGDAQCTDDTAYMQFRKMVRNPAWQQQFLAMPLAQRKAVIASFRQDSKKTNQEKSADIMDVNASVIADLFRETGASVMIHGHTHHPGRHVYRNEDGECVRLVLSDWNLDGDTPRGDWIEIGRDGEIVRHSL